MIDGSDSACNQYSTFIWDGVCFFHFYLFGVTVGDPGHIHPVNLPQAYFKAVLYVLVGIYFVLEDGPGVLL